MSWKDNIRVLYSQEVLQQRIQELGAQITKDYAQKNLCVVAVLKGSVLFFSDLIRAIDLPLTCEFIGISSYGDETTSSGVVQITSDLTRSIEGMDVLIVEDIVDTGLTIKYLLENFKLRKPNSVQVCSLLEKPDNLKTEINVQYIGFTIPNVFVVGYGLDRCGKLRNLPFVGIAE